MHNDKIKRIAQVLYGNIKKSAKIPVEGAKENDQSAFTDVRKFIHYLKIRNLLIVHIFNL